MFAKLIIVLLVVFDVFDATIAAVINNNSKQNAKTKEPWELLEALRGEYGMQSFNGTWITDEEFYYTATDRSIHKYNVASDNNSIFVPSSILEIYGAGSSFKVSPDNKRILIRYDVEQIFRHSSIAKYDVYDLETANVIKINNGKKLQYCNWSPLNDRLAYVYEYNVYVHLEDGSEIQLTTDGVTGTIYNGIPDWVYEEEVLSKSNAIWWSPDGQNLVVGNFNDTKVNTFHYAIYGNANDPSYQYPKEEDLKYPKPGTPNPIVELRVFNVARNNGKRLVPLILKAPTDIVSNDHIMQDIVWANKENIMVLWLNRRQNLGTLQICTLSGECREVRQFSEPNGWITMTTPICQSSGNSCIFKYWIGDWMQAWKIDLKTGSNLWKSKGEFEVTAIYGYDELNDKLYYQATLQGRPNVFHVFSDNECLTCNMRDLDNEICQNAYASFSKNFSYYSVVCSGPGPRYSRIYETKTNKLVKNWEENLAYRKMIANKLMPIVRLMNVTLSDGTSATVRLKLPPNFDEKKKYPMIVYVYGGPDSLRCTTSFEIRFDAYITTARNVIYASIDGHGSSNKGKKFLFSVNNDLGHYEVEDQIFVTKYLQKQFPYIDRERTGIWGWSYGGYATAKVLASDTERIFQCGISVAPVTSWLYYDSIYTERYMGLPTESDNLKHYDSSSVFKNVKNFKNHDFLLIHGSADDNVHYQQSLALAKTLEKNDIFFEQMTYVDENHSIGSFTMHLYHTMEHFWNNYLSLDMDEEE